MLDEAMSAVEDFHKQMNIDYRARLSDYAPSPKTYEDVADVFKYASERELDRYKMTVDTGAPDYRHLRDHLNWEEEAEIIEAMWEGDEVKLLDAICDRMYVLIGMAITFDLPLAEGFAEVHRSNMTKSPSKGSDNPRLRDKGQAYDPPNLQRVIDEHRSKKS